MDSRHEIEKLIYTYAERIDLGDFDGVARLFASATYAAAGRPALSGSEQVCSVLTAMVKLYDGIPRTKHVTTNVIVEVDQSGAQARARSYFSVLQSAPEGIVRVVVAGRYHDRFEKDSAAWRFTERVVFMDLVGDVSDHLRTVPSRAGE